MYGQQSSRRGKRSPSGADDLLVWQDSIPDGMITSVQEETQQAYPLGGSSCDLADVRRPSYSFVKGHPKIRSSDHPFD